MYCPNCGTQLPDGIRYCGACGAATQPQAEYDPVYRNTPAKPDQKNFGFALLGFFIPIVGIILYFCWKDETPLKAKSCIKGALVSIILSVIFGILGFALFFFAALMGAAESSGFAEEAVQRSYAFIHPFI